MLPDWLLPTSSPARSNGTPCASIRHDSKLRRSCRRNFDDLGSSVGPSTPQLVLSFSSRAVSVLLAIRLVVLALVADEIGERETVMDGDEVDARARAAAVLVEQIGRAGHATAELADYIALAGQ